MQTEGSLTRVSMGAATVAATPGPGLASFAGGGLSASITWDVVAGSALSYFKGLLDDVRVYSRALNALEVQDLYRAGWQLAVPAQTGSSVVATSWSAAAPDGLEGYYRLDLRARDQEGNVSPANPDAWRGDVDTLGPRVTLTQSTVDSLTNRYSMAAQDFNLTETGFQSPCGAGVIAGRRYFDSSWYLAVGAEDRLYELDSECALSVYATQNEVGAYATAGLAHSVAVSDTHAYVAAGAAGLQVVDISDPGQPSLAARPCHFRHRARYRPGLLPAERRDAAAGSASTAAAGACGEPGASHHASLGRSHRHDTDPGGGALPQSARKACPTWSWMQSLWRRRIRARPSPSRSR